MKRRYVRKRNETAHEPPQDTRIKAAALFVYLFAAVLIGRLFVLMVLQHDFYTALAAGNQEIVAQLFPKRGEIFVQDTRSEVEYPIAMNRDFFTLFADTRFIDTEDDAEDIAEALSPILGYDDEEKFALFLQLNKEDDPYEPIEQKVDDETAEAVQALDIEGIGAIRRLQRFYPEGDLASHVLGFVGKDAEGSDVGRYGIEGYWEDVLAGSGGFLSAAKSAGGWLLPLADRQFEPAEDGADILLTIDRTIQFQACERLRAAYELFEAESASLVVLDPDTGAVLAMCSYPTFDPNIYNQVETIDVYNNTAVFEPYEPGSIFKPIAAAAALNEGVITPETSYVDTGKVVDICDRPISNADFEIYDEQTMTNVLEKSINTGMVHIVEQIGKKVFRTYVEDFGFGVKEGIQLATENTGTIDSLYINKGDRVDCYAATASFGQGITATPLQMAAAFGAIANGGTLMKPYIVEEVRHDDGKVERTHPAVVREVLHSRAASLLSGMLVSVVDNGFGSKAQVPGYYVAGKTGTAQIAGPGGYTDETNHSFAGFGPAGDPKFAIAIRLSKPKTKTYSSLTTAPIFADIAQMIFDHYGVPPVR